jgi:isopentenyldiphosphate isomerase
MINTDELLFVVDESNNPIEPKPRKQVHSEGFWHRTAHIWVINSGEQILCQKRSMLKDSNPGKWEAFFGGHMAPGEEYKDNAIIELKEELGISVDKEDLQFFEIFKHERAHEFQAVYYINWNGDINTLKLEKEEVDQVKLFSLEEIYKTIVEEQNKNWTITGYEKDFFKHLRKT